MSRRGLAALAALAALALAGDGPSRPAAAQPASMVGTPLPVAELPVGTLRVRVVAGAITQPVAGAEVRLVAGEGATPRTVAADDKGVAVFPGLPPGALVRVEIDGAADAVTSTALTLPADTGVAVVLSTTPWAGGAPRQPPMSPRAMSGQARPERNDPPGRLTVRLSRDDWSDVTGLGDLPVVFAAYGSDGALASTVVRTDPGGRATLDLKDSTGNTAYYVLATVPRDGVEDRLASLPVMPHAQAGLRLALSGERAGSGKPRVDDLERYGPQADLPPGTIIGVFPQGDLPKGTTVELLDLAERGKPISTAQVTRGRPIPSSIAGTFGAPTADPAIPAGTLEVRVQVAAGAQRLGLPRAPVVLRAVGGAPGAYQRAGTTDADGRVRLDGAPAGQPLEVVVDLEGTPLTSGAVTLPAGSGAALQVDARFQLLSLTEAAFQGAATAPDRAYALGVTVDGERYLSPPFQVLASRGVVAPVFVTPRIRSAFQVDAFLDDEFLAMRATFTVQNASFAPWSGPSEGLRIPAPRGATGLRVSEEDEGTVSADAADFRLLRPVPPMGLDVRVGWSLRVEDGRASFDLPLPLGASRSSLALQQTPGMTLSLPPGVAADRIPQGETTWLAIRNIEIPAGQRMVFGIAGLPQRPGWQQLGELLAAALAVVLVAGGVVLAVRRPPAARPPDEELVRQRRIDALLDEVAELDRRETPNAREHREALVAELERLYRRDPAEG